QGDVADQASDGAAPRALHRGGQDQERLEVGPQEHVRLLDAREAHDRGTVEHDLAVEGLLAPGARHLDLLDLPEADGELEPEEVDGLLLQPRPPVVDRRCHSVLSSYLALPRVRISPITAEAYGRKRQVVNDGCAK